MRRSKPLLQILLLLLLAAPVVVSAQVGYAAQPPLHLVVYIAPDGDDAQDCATPLRRCATLQRGLDLLASGGEARLAAGTYIGTTEIERPATVNGGYSLPDYLPGEAPSVLDGQRQGTTLWIDSVIWVRLNGLTITGGLANPDAGMTGRGGGIFVRDASVTLDRVVVSGNIADSGGSGRGGGIYVRDGSLALLRSKVISNTAALIASPADRVAGDQTIIGSGGGLYAEDSRLTIWQSLLVGNSAIQGAQGTLLPTRGWGGGLYAEGCALELDTVRFVGNNALAAAGSGGAIKLLDSQAWLRGGEISDNQTASDSSVPSRGGGLDILGGTTSLMNVVLRRNSAVEGSGIRLQPHADVISDTSALTMTNALLADHGGAALELVPNAGVAARANVRYTTLISNSVGLRAGAQQAIDVTNSVLVGNQVAAQTSAGGMVMLRYTNRYGNAQAAVGDVRVGPAGDLALPPGFVLGDPSFRLARDSMLLDRGELLADITTDHEGQPRHVDGDRDGVAKPDLGWDELVRSAVGFGPEQTLFARPMQRLTTTLDIRNSGLATDTFQLRIMPPRGWAAQVQPTQVVLGPRTRARLTITIAVPATAPLNTQSLVMLWAVGQTSTATTRLVVNVGAP
jgi:hypothetical protein